MPREARNVPVTLTTEQRGNSYARLLKISFRVREFLPGFGRIKVFYHYLVMLEQALEELLVRLQPASIGPVALNGVTNFS